MPSRPEKLSAWLRERAPARIELQDLDELSRLLAPLGESSLRRLLRSTGASLHPLVAGVDQSTFETLSGSLRSLSDCYESGGTAERHLARKIVIIAKDHAKLAAKNPKLLRVKQIEKLEMAEWMLVWLENPGIFPVWLQVRRRKHGRIPGASQ